MTNIFSSDGTADLLYPVLEFIQFPNYKQKQQLNETRFIHTLNKISFLHIHFNVVLKSISIIIYGSENMIQWNNGHKSSSCPKKRKESRNTQVNQYSLHLYLIFSCSDLNPLYMYRVPKSSILGKCILIISLVRKTASGRIPSGVFSCLTQKCITSTSEPRNSAVTFVLSNMRNSQPLPAIKIKMMLPSNTNLSHKQNNL